jgi:hypothetical protein
MRRDLERGFIGRQPEIDLLHRELAAAIAGQPRVVLLAG